MSNLSNLFISQSFFGIINLENSLEPLISASGDVQLQDGAGDNLGLKINAQTKEFTIVNNLRVDGNADFNGNVDFSGSLTHTGSLDVLGDITASGNIKATIGNFDTVNTRVLHVTQESASVIFSSGSNVLGDEETDRQDLIGQVIVSGTLGLEGNASFTGSLTVSNEISSSTIAGLGNATQYSQSVDTKITTLSSSVDSRLDDLEFFSSSQYQTDSSSFDSRIDQLEADTGSQDTRLDSLEAFTGSQETLNGFYNSFTASNGNTSLNSFTSSADSRLDNLETFTSSFDVNFVSTGSFNAYTQSQDNLNATFATTGSNTFSGSINGEVIQLSISSLTSSIDCSLGNFFNLSLVGGVDTHLNPTNIKPGQTITIRVNQVGSTPLGTISSSPSIQYAALSPYSASANTSATDVVSYVTFDDNNLYGSAVKRFI